MKIRISNIVVVPCLQKSWDLASALDYAGGIPGVEALSAQKRLDALLSYKLKLEYTEMCGFVRSRMSLGIVRSNGMLVSVPWGKEVPIQQRPELTDGVVMVLLAPWLG